MDTKSIQVPKALSFQIFHFHKKVVCREDA